MSNQLKKYKCHKEVHARPMTRGEFVQYKYPNSAVNLELDQNEPGYLVVYSDSYESWSPATVFDEGYTEVVDLVDLVEFDDDCGGACKI